MINPKIIWLIDGPKNIALQFIIIIILSQFMIECPLFKSIKITMNYYQVTNIKCPILLKNSQLENLHITIQNHPSIHQQTRIAKEISLLINAHRRFDTFKSIKLFTQQLWTSFFMISLIVKSNVILAHKSLKLDFYSIINN